MLTAAAAYSIKQVNPESIAGFSFVSPQYVTSIGAAGDADHNFFYSPYLGIDLGVGTTPSAAQIQQMGNVFCGNLRIGFTVSSLGTTYTTKVGYWGFQSNNNAPASVVVAFELKRNNNALDPLTVGQRVVYECANPVIFLGIYVSVSSSVSATSLNVGWDFNGYNVQVQ